MRKLRVLVMLDDDLVPPDSIEGMTPEEVAPFKTEWDVCDCLRKLGHSVMAVGVRFDLNLLKTAMAEFRPHLCFNLVEDFNGIGTFDQHVVSYLELMGVPYTGCNPRGLTLARDKGLTKKLLSYHGIAVPKFEVFPPGRAPRRPEGLEYPLVVKSTVEEGSMGISQASYVTADDQLAERVAFVHEKFNTDAIAEQYIEGRELYVGILGNRQLTALPVWELVLDHLPPDAPRIATRRVKMDAEYQKRYGIVSRAAADVPPALQQQIISTCRQAYRILNLSGYARMDLRLTANGEIYLIEANPNPQIARNEDFADSAAAIGLSYEALIAKILRLGLGQQRVSVAA